MRRPLGVTDRDKAQLRDVTQAIRRVGVGTTPVLRLIADPLRDLLRGSRAGGFGLRATESGIRCAFVHAQLPAQVMEDMDRSLAASPTLDSWARYNPVAPAPKQRNRVEHVTPEMVQDRGLRPVLERHGLMVPHTRVLVCEGASLLAWVGCFRDEPATLREEWLLQQLVEPLRDRLLMERRLEVATQAAVTLDLIMEHIPAAAFVVSKRGHVLHANAAGKARLEQERVQLVRKLAASIHGSDAELDVHATYVGQEAPQYLVISRPERANAARAETAASRWSLTRRQREVLDGLLNGYSNARISAELCISPRTVEVHISAILARAQVSSRAELIASVYS